MDTKQISFVKFPYELDIPWIMEISGSSLELFEKLAGLANLFHLSL